MSGSPSTATTPDTSSATHSPPTTTTEVTRLAVAEVPGPQVCGKTSPSPGPAGVRPRGREQHLWHIPFNRVNDELIVDMVKSNANAYYRNKYQVQGGGKTLPDYAIEYYIKLYTRDRNALRASFGFYRPWDAHLTQYEARQQTKLTIPVLGIGGANSWGDPLTRDHACGQRQRRDARDHPRAPATGVASRTPRACSTS